MKTLVIVAHPDMNQSKVNKGLMEEIRKHPEITIHELNKEYPDEKINIEKEHELLLDHDRIVLQFPFYWYSVPYLLKKWEEFVLSYGWAYGPGGDRLKGKELIIATSTGAPEHAYVAGGYQNYSMSELLKPLQATSNLIGTKFLIPYVFHSAMTPTDEEVEAGAKAYVEHVFNPKLSNY